MEMICPHCSGRNGAHAVYCPHFAGNTGRETVVIPPPPSPKQYAILELMGHVRLVGVVTEEEKFGSKLGRIDVIDRDGAVTHTRYFSAQVVYSLTHVSEAAARAAARTSSPAPVSEWDLPQDVKDAIHAARERKALPASTGRAAGSTPYPAKPATDDELDRLADDGGRPWDGYDLDTVGDL